MVVRCGDVRHLSTFQARKMWGIIKGEGKHNSPDTIVDLFEESIGFPYWMKTPPPSGRRRLRDGKPFLLEERRILLIR